MREVVNPSARYRPTAASLSASTKSIPTSIPRAASDARPADGQRTPEPTTVPARDRHRSRRSRRARRARAGVAAGCTLVQQKPARPSSSNARRKPSGSNQASCSRARSMSTVHAPCSGWPAKARLFTVDPRRLVLAGRRTCGRSTPSGQRGGSASGSGTRICRRSRSGTKPGAARRGVGRRRRRRRAPSR